MATMELISPRGGLLVEPNVTYTSTDVPSALGIDTVTLTRGVRIVDEDGNPTPIRGVRMLVSVVGTTYPKPNIPTIWFEGQSITFLASTNYTFLDKGLVSFGVKVVV